MTLTILSTQVEREEPEMIATCTTPEQARQHAAASALQDRIDAQQRFDAIDYALRSIKTCGGERHCVGVHAGQLSRGCFAAARILGREAIYADGSSAAYWLRHAKGEAREELEAAKAAVKQLGNVRQLRLALAGG